MRQFKRKWTLDRQKFLSEVEVKKLRRVVEDKALADAQKGRSTWPRFWMVLDLAIGAGLRVSEIANLKVDDLYLNSWEPRIRVNGNPTFQCIGHGQQQRPDWVYSENFGP